MALLRALLAGLLAGGCYAPALPDCVVACANDGDCAPAQTCGADGWCAAPDVAGACHREPSLLDAATDGAGDDAALPACEFTIEIEGKGRVVIDGLVACTHMAPGHTCAFVLPMAPHDVIAIPEPREMFERWTAGACLGQDDSCYLALCTATTSIGVRFRRED